jgi:hypothetical protein
VIPGLETESDCSDKEEIAGEELEVALDCFGNVIVVVLAEGGFPKKRSTEKAGENVNHHKGRGEKPSGGMGGELVEELREVFPVLTKGPEDVKAEWDVEDFNRDFDKRFDDGISFTKGAGQGEGPHDFVEWADIAGGPGGTEPEGGASQKEGELEAFDSSFFGG